MGEDRRLPDQPLTMRYLALACSYDETVASDGRIDARLWQPVPASSETARANECSWSPMAAWSGPWNEWAVPCLTRSPFLGGRWFSWTQGHLQAGRKFMAEELTGRDFEPTGQGN